jgi:hypothetical protein
MWSDRDYEDLVIKCEKLESDLAAAVELIKEMSDSDYMFQEHKNAIGFEEWETKVCALLARLEVK